MRLENIQSIGKKKQLRVVLDSNKPDCNYCETTSNVFYDRSEGEHKCLKCLEPVNWLEWPTNNTAKSTCKCGLKATLSLKNFDNTAMIYDTGFLNR